MSSLHPLLIIVIAIIAEAKTSEYVANPPKMAAYFSDVNYFDTKLLKMRCLASGTPTPAYIWYRDEKWIKNSTDGSLIIQTPTFRDNGLYKCVAWNKFGVAVSRHTNQIQIVTNTWKQLKAEKVFAVEHEHKKLKCREIPKCVPPPSFDWSITEKHQIQISQRLAVDQEGNLHILNVEVSDDTSHRVGYYFCSVFNRLSQARIYGSSVDLSVKPSGVNVSEYTRIPSIEYSTQKDVVVRMGKALELMCIPSGVPIPEFVWKSGSEVMKNVSHVVILEYTRVLRINGVKEHDQKIYTCSIKDRPDIKREISVTVVSEPIWISDRRPRDTTVIEGSNVLFECNARSANNNGHVTITWYRNGRYLANGYHDNVFVDGTQLKVGKVSKDRDNMVLQCNVSNTHGYQLANAVLRVIKPTKIKTNLVNQKMVLTKGKVVSFNMMTKTDPGFRHVVKFIWKKDGKVISNENSIPGITLEGQTRLVISSTNDTSDTVFNNLAGNYSCAVDIGVPSALQVKWQSLLIKPKKAAVHVAHFPYWIIGVIAGVILLVIVVVLIVSLVYRNRGDVWKIQDKERKAGRNLEKELEQCAFPTLSRASHIPPEFKYPPTADEVPEAEVSVATPDDLQLIDDANVNQDMKEINMFDEDGSFIGEYNDAALGVVDDEGSLGPGVEPTLDEKNLVFENHSEPV